MEKMEGRGGPPARESDDKGKVIAEIGKPVLPHTRYSSPRTCEMACICIKDAGAVSQTCVLLSLGKVMFKHTSL